MKHIHFNIKEETGLAMCGAMKDLHIFYEYSFQNLHDKILEMKRVNKQFNLSELYEILFILIESANLMQDWNFSLNDV